MYKLIKPDNPNFLERSEDIGWIEWKGITAKKTHDKPKVGYSLMMGYNKVNFTWLTTPIIEIIEEDDRMVHFKTKNSEYKLLIYE
jgi:hypothetical protein